VDAAIACMEQVRFALLCGVLCYGSTWSLEGGGRCGCIRDECAPLTTCVPSVNYIVKDWMDHARELAERDAGTGSQGWAISDDSKLGLLGHCGARH